MRILVTGGAGAVGSFVIRELLAADQQVGVFDRRGLAPLIDDVAGEVIEFRGDVRRTQDVSRALGAFRPHRVIHLAAAVGEAAEDSPDRGLEVNALGTLRVLEGCRAHEVERVVLMSTKAVYGDITGRHGASEFSPVTEDHPRRPVTMYGSSKAFAEDIGRTFRRRYGLQVVAARAATTVGPGKGLQHGTTTVTSELIEGPAAGRAVRVDHGGEQVDDFIYNTDLARGLVRMSLVPQVRHDVYHLSSGQGVSLRDIAAVVSERLPEADIEIGPGLDFFGLDYNLHAVLDASRARDDLGFALAYPFPAWVNNYLDLQLS